jgi:vitamin B12 transporter
VRKRLAVVMIVVTSGSSSVVPVVAQETRQVDPVVVTATKIAEPRSQVGATVTVITEEELKTYNYLTVDDALRQVPGLEVQRQGSAGKLSQVRIRGTSTQQIQVLIDGVRVKSPTAGTFDFSDLGLDQIQRIEIVRGPQSTLYGADAIGGVIQIITKRGQGPFSASASSEVGNHDTLRERAGFSGSYKIFDYSFGASWFESNGRFPNDGTEQRGIASRVGVTLPADGHIGLAFRYNRTKNDLPFDGSTPVPFSPFFVLDRDSRQQSETTTLSLQWDQKPVEWFEVHGRVSGFWNQLGFQDPFTLSDTRIPFNFDFADSRSQIDTNRREVELFGAFHFPKWNTLTVGVEHVYEFGRNFSSGFSGAGTASRFSKQIDNLAYYLQDELRLFDRVIVSAGRRHDDPSAFESATTSRFGLVVLVPETDTRVRGSWGEGFRAPTINDLFFPGFANPNLKPERSESWEAGVDQNLFKKRVRLGATYFENKFDDLIQFVSVGSLFRPENVAKAWTQGEEVTIEIEPIDRLLFTANYTHVETKDFSTRGELRRVPHHVGNIGVTWIPIPALTVYTQVNIVSSQGDLAFDPVLFVSTPVRNPGYYRIDLGGVYNIVPKRDNFPALDFTARINNVTDQRYMEAFGFPNLGLNALVGLQARY